MGTVQALHRFQKDLFEESPHLSQVQYGYADRRLFDWFQFPWYPYQPEFGYDHHDIAGGHWEWELAVPWAAQKERDLSLKSNMDKIDSHDRALNKNKVLLADLANMLTNITDLQEKVAADAPNTDKLSDSCAGYMKKITNLEEDLASERSNVCRLIELQDLAQRETLGLKKEISEASPLQEDPWTTDAAAILAKKLKRRLSPR